MKNFKLDFKKITAPISNGKKITGELEFSPGKLIHLRGDNGVGKSSFVQAIKIFQVDLFPKMKLNFIDQKRLEPLNDVNFEQLIKELHQFKHESHQFFYDQVEKISSFKHKPISSLSGGQNQIVKILCSAFLGGDIYFLDEPFGHLDNENKDFLREYLRFLKQKNCYVFVIEHGHEYLKNEIDYTYQLSSAQDKLVVSRINGN